MPPTAPIYVYDGECVLCSRAVRYVLKHDRSDPPVRFVAITSDEGRAIAKDHGVNPDDPETFIYIEDGDSHTHSDAGFALLKRAGGPLACLGVFKSLPRPLRDWAYKLVASNRYKLFGKLDNCYMPSPEDKDRFVL